MSDIRIELYSDTKTKPSAGMREAMVSAEVGDEQTGDDPTTNALCDRTAELLGKEAAVFLPSGTMGNQIALAVHCRPGDEVIAHQLSHIIGFESGGPGAISGVMIRSVEGKGGIFDAASAEAAIRPQRRHAPVTKLIAVEQTHNGGGGTVWPLATLQQVAQVAWAHGLAVHMDGARLFNAAVAAGVSAREFAATCDTVWIDLSKGLGCPVGAVLAGSSDFIHEAWRWKQRLGGAMRQSGVIAAAGLYALDNNVERLAEDHRNARLFADLIADIPGVAVDPDGVETNIIFFDVAGTGLTATEISKRLEAQGVRISLYDDRLMRALTHLDVDEAGVREGAEVLRSVILAG